MFRQKGGIGDRGNEYPELELNLYTVMECPNMLFRVKATGMLGLIALATTLAGGATAQSVPSSGVKISRK
jgi:hypothetical protein